MGALEEINRDSLDVWSIQIDPLAGLQEQLQEKKERQRMVPLASPYSTGAAAILSALSIELHVPSHLNKSILLLKKWLKTIGSAHIFLC